MGRYWVLIGVFKSWSRYEVMVVHGIREGKIVCSGLVWLHVQCVAAAVLQ